MLRRFHIAMSLGLLIMMLATLGYSKVTYEYGSQERSNNFRFHFGGVYNKKLPLKIPEIGEKYSLR